MCQTDVPEAEENEYTALQNEARNRDYVDNIDSHIRCAADLGRNGKHRLGYLHTLAARVHKLADDISVAVEVEAMLLEKAVVVVFTETRDLDMFRVWLFSSEEEATRKCRGYFRNDKYELGDTMICTGDGYRVATKDDNQMEYPRGTVETDVFLPVVG